jgi:hypothetical protein
LNSTKGLVPVRMFVVLPQDLAASQLRQCERHLEEVREDPSSLLYAAQFAHMAFHVIMIAHKYSGTGLKIFRDEEKTPYLKEGIPIKSFRQLLRGIEMGKDKKEAILRLTDIRDRLQHPIPGPMGYVIPDLISAVQATIEVAMTIWRDLCARLHFDRPLCDETLVTSLRILDLCKNIASCEKC